MQTQLGKLNRVLKASLQQKTRQSWPHWLTRFDMEDIRGVSLLANAVVVHLDHATQIYAPKELSLPETKLLIEYLAKSSKSTSAK